MAAEIQTTSDGLLRRFITFPLTLLVIEFVIVAGAAILASNALRMAIGGGRDGPMQALAGQSQ